MVMTVLEARVAPQKQETLRSAFQSAVQRLEEGIVETYLVVDSKDGTVWRILTVWKDREALNAMRRSGSTPRGVLIFREAGSEPSLSILDVSAHAPLSPTF